MFRKRTKFSEKMKAARKAKERKRLEGDASDFNGVADKHEIK